MNISPKGLALTKSFEGCKLHSYKDQGGVWTIGYGHTGPEVVAGLTWTQQQADDALMCDMETAVKGVNTNVKNPDMNQNQFDALTDFAYNLGVVAFAGSMLLDLFNQGAIAGAAAQFLRWDHIKGKVVPGLLRRRQAEAALFQETI